MYHQKPFIKIINDPVYGFINITDPLVFALIEHPFFQRLRRIQQMGLSNLVYPGAHHTRFHHAIGCVHLMQKAIVTLRNKGTDISDKEAQALQIAILLHDIGHGPFSHALEGTFMADKSHEQISLALMQMLNKEFGGQLTLAIEIFENKYHRNFFYQLISSQLDIDRLDYLNRDSFYTGVVEGSINSDRLIAMFQVHNDTLVVEEKGIFSIEKFLMSRRFMYWQVYLHKTGLIAEKILEKIIVRAKELSVNSMLGKTNRTLDFFLSTTNNDRTEDLIYFLQLDDYDIWNALKIWQFHEDYVLSTLSKSILLRRLPKILFSEKPFSELYISEIKELTKNKFLLNDELVDYFVIKDTVENVAYHPQYGTIKVLLKNGEVKDWLTVVEHFNADNYTQPIVKHFISYPKEIVSH